ncbi:hypothetical protein Mcup_1812 [Metallosphaera cuprina Ar-4]|uniref:Uncharacterized protein n=1 Tax=Metallosphaera cuprina (strain Ar-4) TaxID=1006006 RepID=F4G0V6_METCR|nr:hypothetical protein Mcup_1812 [Metallosphaera cuprina Ar-4]
MFVDLAAIVINESVKAVYNMERFLLNLIPLTSLYNLKNLI